MKIAYHQPSMDVIYAHRVIYHGFKNAFEDMGHIFSTYTAGMSLEDFLEENKPDIFITASHFFWRKQLDYDVLKKARNRGMKVFVRIDFWNSPFLAYRVNEAPSMKNDAAAISLIKTGMMGDIFFHVSEQNDPRLEGFQETTGYPYYTIPLAADAIIMRRAEESRFQADISFIGTNLPQKRTYFKEWLRPLGKKYNLRIYGQDWTIGNRLLGHIQRAGQYFNIPYIKSLRKPPLQLDDEAKIYSSSQILVNIHEDYQRHYGKDCNERTFKILACGGFEITDDVECIRKYYKEGKEIVVAKDKYDWFKKIDYYMKNPDEAKKIAKAGQARTLKDHTYHNRAQQIIDLFHTI